MKVICIDITNKNLSEETLSQGYIIKQEFEELQLDKEYMIYGISLWGNVLYYFIIIDDDRDVPIWYPADLFKVSDNSLPRRWFFKHYGYKEDDLSSIWGYEELVIDEMHYYELVEREQRAIEVFLKRKNEMDEQ